MDTVDNHACSANAFMALRGFRCIVQIVP